MSSARAACGIKAETPVDPILGFQSWVKEKNAIFDLTICG
jgi:hypothetical protein